LSVEFRQLAQMNDSWDVYESDDLREISRSCQDSGPIRICTVTNEVIGAPETQTFSINEWRLGLIVMFGGSRPGRARL